MQHCSYAIKKISYSLEESLDLLKDSPRAAFLGSPKLIPILVDHIVSISNLHKHLMRI